MTAPTLDRPAQTEHPMVPRPFRVRSVAMETPETATLTLEPVNGIPLQFRSGQFTMLGRPGHGEVPISISGDPAQPELLVHTVRSVGDATAAIVAAEPGDLLLARGPYGRGWEVSDGAGRDVIVIAGGIGLAPLRPVVYELLAQRDRYARVSIVVGARTPDQLLYRRELELWRGRFDVEVAVTVDVAATAWRGHVGLVTSAMPLDGYDDDETLALVCGPEIMMRLSADALVTRGVNPDRVRVSVERNMKCGLGFCGHCQLRELFTCADGPVLPYSRVADMMRIREL